MKPLMWGCAILCALAASSCQSENSQTSPAPQASGHCLDKHLGDLSLVLSPQQIVRKSYDATVACAATEVQISQFIKESNP